MLFEIQIVFVYGSIETDGAFRYQVIEIITIGEVFCHGRNNTLIAFNKFFSCGKRFFTGATLIVRKIKGILRAGIGTVIPLENPTLLLDTGANVTVTEENLEQFAEMGSAYMQKMYRLERPRVGLLNNGTESCKGTELQQAAYRRLEANPNIQFVGNVEGSAVPFGVCDVIVADGFTGNIFLKTVEGISKALMKRLKGVLYSSPATKLAALTMKKQFTEMKKELDPNEHGGAPILGISKPVVKAHGSSDAKAFKNAIRQAISYADSDVIYDLALSAQRFSEMRRAEHEKNNEKT